MDEERPDPRTEGSPDDDVWAGIVAAFHASPSLPDEASVPDEAARPEGGTEVGAGTHEDAATAETAVRSAAAPEPEEHFEPPPPPPSPPLDPVSRLAWSGTLGGPLVLLAAALLGWDAPQWLVALAVIGFVGGFVTLVARMRHDDPYDGDNGAVV